MTDDRSVDEPFDLDKLRQLFELMEKHGVTEVSLRGGDEQWKLRRGPRETPVAAAPPQLAFTPPPGFPPAPQAAAPSSPEPAEEAAPPSDVLVIKSPTVGTFYSAPSPDDPPFVQVGSKVQEDTNVCIVEAMKVFNQIPAEVSGTIVKICVSNGDPVEFGQTLFEVRPG